MRQSFWIRLSYDRVEDQLRFTGFGFITFWEAREKYKKHEDEHPSVLLGLKGDLNDNQIYNTWLDSLDIDKFQREELAKKIHDTVMKALKRRGYFKREESSPRD